MKIINKTQGTVLADNALMASTMLKRLVGLLNRDNLNPGEALIIKPSNSIHTFFMRFTIDVIFINKNNIVVKIISGMRPFRLTPVYIKANSVIEVPWGIIKSTATKVGDIIDFSSI